MREEHLDTQVNEMIGKALGLAFITPKQFASFLVIGFLSDNSEKDEKAELQRDKGI